MTEQNQALISAEYTTLRTELLENKKYVFERPLLIITAAGIASVQLSGKASVAWLPFLLIVLLLINLWFTVNRLGSIARIAAYICVVLESKPEIWIGWESALRIHRIWMKTHGGEDQDKLLERHIEPSAIPDAMMFYPPLFLLHVATVVVALGVCSQAFIENQPHGAALVPYIATVGIAAVFGGYCLGPYYPTRMRNLIERQRAIWLVSLKDNNVEAEHVATADASHP